ncbi:MAG: DUF5421 family protein [Chlamydiales bacterium]
MMGVPPTRRPHSPPPSKGRDDKERGPEGTSQKKFRLPDRKDVGEKDTGKKELEQKEEKSVKKKNLFDLAAAEGEGKAKQIKEEISEGQQVEAEELQKLEAGEAKSQVSQIGQLIQKMVDRMQIGTVGGKDFASIDLSSELDVPETFAGSNLTLSFQENGLVIRFDNFMSPQQEQDALIMVEKNKEQLLALVQNLQAKNIQVAEFNIGNRSVTLPVIEPQPSPFKPTPPPSGAELGERERREPEEENE